MAGVLGRPVNGFMHINGVTYELGPQKDANAISQLAMRLKAPQGTQHQIVILNGQRVELTIDLAVGVGVRDLDRGASRLPVAGSCVAR